MLGTFAVSLFSPSKSTPEVTDSKMVASSTKQGSSVISSELEGLVTKISDLQKETSENRLLFTVLLAKLADVERRETDAFASLGSKLTNTEELIMDVKREVVILKKSTQVRFFIALPTCPSIYHILSNTLSSFPFYHLESHLINTMITLDHQPPQLDPHGDGAGLAQQQSCAARLAYARDQHRGRGREHVSQREGPATQPRQLDQVAKR